MKLPLRLPWDQASDRWATILTPIVESPSSSPVTLSNIKLVSGDNVINHTLGRKLTGWSLSRIRAVAAIYDKQDTNQAANLTLVLNSSANVVIDLSVW